MLLVFLLGLLIGAVVVMLFWLSSPACISFDLFGRDAQVIDSSAREVSTGSGTLISADGSGRTIMTTGEPGTPAQFIDVYGNERDMICYASIYCIDETPCPPCEEEECVDNGERCGYWPGEPGTLAANYQMEGVDYGECCPPYECVDGYCRPGQEECVDYGETCRTDEDCCEGYCYNGICTYDEEECVETGETCGYVQPASATHATTPVYYGECCPPDECINNLCTPPEECQDYGELCGYAYDYSDPTHVMEKYYGECCPPYVCVDNNCGYEECRDYGESCGTMTYVTGSEQIEQDMGECCEPYECVDNICTYEEQECVDYGMECEYGPNYAFTTAPAGAAWFGYCCEPYACIEGLCGPSCEAYGGSCKTDEECCQGLYCDNNICSECKTSGTCTPGASICCEGYRCWEFRCVEEETCEEEGSQCSEDSDCCGGLVCANGYCMEEPECADIGESCGDYANGMECCSGGFCYMGICEEQTSHLCTDTEDGPDYYSQGSATGEYLGDYGTYTDYCMNDYTVVDYYCQVNGEYSPVLEATLTCPQRCSGGACN